jgi:hypothetical protein
MRPPYTRLLGNIYNAFINAFIGANAASVIVRCAKTLT